MLYEVKGDIVNDTQYTIFCHQVNCQGVMGAGLAKQIRNKYPEVYSDYIQTIHSEQWLLGSKICTPTTDGRVCVSMFAQEDYGRNKCYTNYQAFQIILDGLQSELQMFEFSNPSPYKIAFPEGIGCGLAGGDWNIIKPILEKFAANVPNDVYIVKKEK